jgi:hypothetical protein
MDRDPDLGESINNNEHDPFGNPLDEKSVSPCPEDSSRTRGNTDS